MVCYLVYLKWMSVGWMPGMAARAIARSRGAWLVSRGDGSSCTLLVVASV